MADEEPGLCAGKSCLYFANTTGLRVNTTLTSDCTPVGVACPRSDQRFANLVTVYRCNDGSWYPYTPRPCIDDPSYSSKNIGIIAGCSVGAIISILILIMAIYTIVKSRQQALIDQQKDTMYQEKQRRIWEYRVATAAYNDGYEGRCGYPDLADEHTVFDKPSPTHLYRATDQQTVAFNVASNTSII
jgi:hypothetical protein